MLGGTVRKPSLLAHSRMEPSRRLRIGGIAAVCAAVFAIAAAPADAESVRLLFPQTADATVVQGESATFTLELSALGATQCSATTAPVRINTVYSVDAVGDVASGLPGNVPIETAANRGTSDNCYVKTPVVVPLTVTAASETPVGDYTSVIRFGKGGDGGVDEDGPPLTIHVIAPDAPQPEVLPPPALAPPEILVLGVRKAKPRPTLGQTVLLTLVKGKITFRMPGGAATPLGDPMVVRNGTLVDAANGVVKVTVVRDATGALDSVDAWGTSFKVNQARGNRPTTTLTLSGAVVVARKAARAAKVSVKHSLWANGKGNFKTRGKRASAIVRGTYWLTQETAAGTRVQVNRGLVAVRDFVKKVTVLVGAGRSYVAKPRAAVLRRIPAFTGTLRHR
jgi:hypothetical protein